MTSSPRLTLRPLPHHKLVAYQVAIELLMAVREAAPADAKLREHALRSAKSVCLNIAEGAGRTGRADKARVFGIARGEVVEVAAAIEVAALCGDVAPQAAGKIAQLTDHAYALLTGLAR